ncbi:MAG TPA: hypothetical protein VGV37_25020 [Aliidongia sp.]|uniref:hypothetical protein n=1 Tax=Aliidongia sp. TaxID=1914230 RepID=UPI002DDD20A1|nr:hypothetical protein [Aliidongia sp.]HEV2677818.1 hypothetical protein [Aliidongia sp.]
MESFWVHENFTGSALWIHSSRCPRCHAEHVSNVIHGTKWHGPFEDRDDAVELATRVQRRSVMTGPHSCPICKP